MAKVSVVIPTHNRSHLLSRAIESARVQTYSDIEILVVDDASTDGTYDVVRAYNDVKYLKLDRNLGGGAARNHGVSKAQGEFIAFLDSDDEWLPGKTRKQVELLESNPRVGAVYSRHFAHDDMTGSRVEQHSPLYRGDIRPELLAGRCPKTLSLFLLRREAFEEVGGFDEALPAFQDADLWLRLSRTWQFDAVDEALVIVHEHPGPRITTNLQKRREGLDHFLSKWAGEMSATAGAAAVHTYRDQHLSTLNGNEVLRLVSAGERRQAWSAMLRYLREVGLFNPRQTAGLFLALVLGRDSHYRWKRRFQAIWR